MGRLAQTLARRNSYPHHRAAERHRDPHEPSNKEPRLTNELWAALVGVAGTLGGVIYGAKLSREAARDLLAQQAKAEFASAFTDTLFKLSGSVTESREGKALHILQADYPRHFVAYIRLRSILPKKEQDAIDEAWKQYAKDDDNDLPEEREFYRFKHVLGPESDEHQHMLAAKHINILLAKNAG